MSEKHSQHSGWSAAWVLASKRLRTGGLEPEWRALPGPALWKEQAVTMAAHALLIVLGPCPDTNR